MIITFNNRIRKNKFTASLKARFKNQKEGNGEKENERERERERVEGKPIARPSKGGSALKKACSHRDRELPSASRSFSYGRSTGAQIDAASHS